MVKFYWSYR